MAPTKKAKRCRRHFGDVPHIISQNSVDAPELHDNCRRRGHDDRCVPHETLLPDRAAPPPPSGLAPARPRFGMSVLGSLAYEIHTSRRMQPCAQAPSPPLKHVRIVRTRVNKTSLITCPSDFSPSVPVRKVGSITMLDNMGRRFHMVFDNKSMCTT